MWDYDEVGTHILVDGNVDGQQRKLISIPHATVSCTPWSGRTVRW